MGFSPKQFGLEKTWRASGTGTVTYNSPGTYNLPYGKYDISLSGRGGTGTAAVPQPHTCNPKST